MELKIKENSNGDYEVAFFSDRRDFNSPSSRREQLDWIKSSYNSFFAKVQERDALRELCDKSVEECATSSSSS